MRPVYLLFAIVGCLVGCQNTPNEPPYVPFRDRLMRSPEARQLHARGLTFEIGSLEFVDAPLPAGWSVARVSLTDYGTAAFAFQGDTTTVSQFEVFVVRIIPRLTAPSLLVESADSLNVFSLGYDAGAVPEIHEVIPSDFYWNGFFYCLSERAADLPNWVNAACGVSLFLCVLQNPVGCLATAACAVAYIAPCLPGAS